MRIWRSSPFVAITAVLALAMGIGFTTTMFCIVHGATRSLPFADAGNLVAIRKTAIRATAGGGETRPFDYRTWSDRARALTVLAAYESLSLNLAGDGSEPERINGVAITANAFDVLGAAPLFGRALTVQDTRAGAPPVVLLSHALWQRRFGEDPRVLGRMIRLTGVPHEIVGVMPERFGFPVNAAFWTALPIEGTAQERGAGPRLQAFGRLAPGASLRSARSELEVLTRQAYTSAGAAKQAQSIGIEVMPFQDLETPPEVVRGLYLLLVAVSFVLLIACGNVANLLLARAAARSRDVAVRLALGATRSRIVREQLAETLSLSLAATAAGLAFAHIATRLFAAKTGHIIEAFWVDFRIDFTVMLFASVLAGIATLASGVGPALAATRRNVADALKDGGQSASRLAPGRVSRGVIGVQVTLACGLLALTMVLARTSVAIRTVPWPFDPTSILTFEFELPDAAGDDIADRNRRLTDIARAMNETPGVSAAAMVTALPGRGGGTWIMSLDRPADDRTTVTTAASFVSPEFFDVTGAQARAGRLLTWRDVAGSPRVIVVNESFVRRFSADRDPIGRRVFLGNRDFTIVGVVPDLVARDVQEQRQDGLYASILQARPFGVRVMARGPADHASMMSALRATLRRIEPDMPLTEIFMLREAVYRDKQVLDVLSALFLAFGLGALALTAIGLYGVVSFTVTQRIREFAIRLALGATRSQILLMVLRQGGRQLVTGLAAGLLLAIALSRGFAAAVEQIPAADAPLLMTIAAALSLTALAALVVPAQRAARLPIVRALRNE